MMFSNHQILGYPTFGQTNSLDNFDGQKCWFVTKWRWIKSLGQCQRLQIGYPILSHSHVILALLSLAHFVFWTGNTDEEVRVQRALRVFDMFEIGSNTWTKGMHRLAGLFACFCVFFWVCVCCHVPVYMSTHTPRHHCDESCFACESRPRFETLKIYTPEETAARQEVPRLHQQLDCGVMVGWIAWRSIFHS